MVTVILMMVPLTIPKLFGIRIYGVLTGSMTPAYSVGGVVYVKETDASDIQIGDAITFRMGTNTDYVMTHRVVEMDGSFFVTKGDANDTVDPEPVSYDRLIGKVVLFAPGLAGVSEFVNSTTGRSVLVMLFAASFILWVAADLLSPSPKKKKGIRSKTQQSLQAQSPNPGEEPSLNQPVKQKKQRASLAIQLLGLVLILGAVFYLGSVFWGYRRSTSEYNALEAEIFARAGEAEEQAAKQQGAEDTAEETDMLTLEEQEILAGIARLREENPDVIGWIKFDNLELSYPVMQGEDDEYYLKHTFSGEANAAGSIFMEAANSPDFNDSHTIIYGHNMKNKSMFGALKTYKTEDFYPGNEYFTIYTPDKVYRYEIFAYYDIPMDGEIYSVQFEPGGVFQKIIDNMCKRSYYDTKIHPESTEKIITLSTCSTKGNRFVVNARRISEKIQ